MIDTTLATLRRVTYLSFTLRCLELLPLANSDSNKCSINIDICKKIIRGNYFLSEAHIPLVSEMYMERTAVISRISAILDAP